MIRTFWVALLLGLFATGCACRQGVCRVQTRFAFDCADGLVVRARYSTDGNRVHVEYSGRSWRLHRSVIGSRVRYSDGRVTFWEKDGKAFLERNGEVITTDCVARE